MNAVINTHMCRLDNGSSYKNPFQITQWSSVDIFCYFSHNLVTIPTLPWINLCRSHGTQIVGTFITEWDQGAAFYIILFHFISVITSRRLFKLQFTIW